VLNAASVLIEGENLAPLAQQMHQISSVTAAGVQNPHSRSDVSAQNLIEDVNIDLPELFLHAQLHMVTVFLLCTSSGLPGAAAVPFIGNFCILARESPLFQPLLCSRFQIRPD
jgi:hypothetical protein